MHSDDDMTEWEFETIHNSRPPLRWIANMLGDFASSAIMRISYAQDMDSDNGWRYKRDCLIWDTLWPIYDKYGTMYRLKTEEDYLD